MSLGQLQGGGRPTAPADQPGSSHTQCTGQCVSPQHTNQSYPPQGGSAVGGPGRFHLERNSAPVTGEPVPRSGRVFQHTTYKAPGGCSPHRAPPRTGERSRACVPGTVLSWRQPMRRPPLLRLSTWPGCYLLINYNRSQGALSRKWVPLSHHGWRNRGEPCAGRKRRIRVPQLVGRARAALPRR